MQGVKTKFPFMQVSREKYSFYAGWQGKIFTLCRMAKKNIHFMQDGKGKFSFYAGWQGKKFILCRIGNILIFKLGVREEY